MLKVLSLGAGVQSSVIALMSAAGELPPIDHAIFADTGWEPKGVYEWLHGYLIPRLPFPVHIVSKGNLREEQITARVRGSKRIAGDARWASLPYYTKEPGANREGTIRRQCTGEYKITPIEQKIRELLGLRPRQRFPKQLVVQQWLGISLDEMQRMKFSTDCWREFWHPLVAQRMTRWDCLKWLERNGHPQAPRSACIGCPFHSNEEWRRMRDSTPDEWADAVEFDKAIRVSGGMRGETFLHRSCKPLDEVDLTTAADHGQLSFLDECAGVCGVLAVIRKDWFHDSLPRTSAYSE
jgi:hypothetical protein